jgi:4-hydroxy-tetrahydrodipicolinate synthase
LVAWQIGEGSTGLVPVGTTGESPTLSHEEHEAVVKAVVEAAAGRVPVIAGAGSNNTVEAIRFVEFAKSVGADAALGRDALLQQADAAGLIAHFEALNEIGLPIIIYNIPPRSVIDMTPETMGAVGEAAEYRRGERRDRRSGPRARDADHLRDRFRATLRRGCHRGRLQCARGSGVYLRDGECRAEALRRDAGRNGRRRLCGGAKPIRISLMPLHQAIFAEPGLCGAKYGLSVLGRLWRRRCACRSPRSATSTKAHGPQPRWPMPG